MIDWIIEQCNRLQLRSQQWKFHRQKAKLLSTCDLKYHAAGHGHNAQLVKACRNELRNHQWTL